MATGAKTFTFLGGVSGTIKVVPFLQNSLSQTFFRKLFPLAYDATSVGLLLGVSNGNTCLYAASGVSP
jgi:hypothetical protein